jgi:two-component system, LytTR family, sensor kinase
VYGLVWLAVIGLSLAGSYFNALLLDGAFHIRQELPFIARWLVWIPLTPLAFFFADKVVYAGSAVLRFFAWHLSVYILLCALHILAASSVALAINRLVGLNGVYTAILSKCAITGVFYNFIVYAVVLLIVNGGRYYEALRAEQLRTILLQKDLSESRLQFLKQQLQPHFLFNAHHSVITLVKMGEKEKAAMMLEQLSELMRAALRDVGEQKVTLEQELQTLALYIGIQQVRFEDKMRVEYAIDDRVRTALVPDMILQPIVENSVKYNVERSAGPSRIRIAAASVGGELCLSVYDQGASKVQGGELKKGIGLTNSEERLARLYGTMSALSLCGNAAGDGAEVTIRIPLQYATV